MSIELTAPRKAINANVFLSHLQQRVSKPNASLLLATAKIRSGVNVENDVDLGIEQAKDLCMKMINQGGPSFQVGQAIYKEYLM